MFIRFEGGKPSRSHTVQCRSFNCAVSKSGREKTIKIDGEEGEYSLQMGPSHWNRAYIMNDNGNTIETIYAPFIQQRQEGAGK